MLGATCQSRITTGNAWVDGIDGGGLRRCSESLWDVADYSRLSELLLV